MPKPRLAILDDYQGIAAPKFAHLSHAIDVETFGDHLDPSDPAQHEALIRRLHPFTIVSTMRERTPLPASVIAALPHLQLVLTTGTKNASIDAAACAARGIVVAGATGTGGAHPGPPDRPTSLDSTLEHAWALILGLSRNIARDDAAVKSGGWEGSPLATGLRGKTLGVLGLGRLGADAARVGAAAFGMRVLAWSSGLTQERAADVVSVHYVLSERSRGLLGERELRLMKPGAVLVNTSRGPLVDEGALLRVLKEGRIRGAALDVFDREPLPADSEWRTVKWGKQHGRSEVLLSPHMGYAEESVMHRWYEDTAQNVEDWLAGKPLAARIV